jgi:membrane protease YdiL (CAAX protease family)
MTTRPRSDPAARSEAGSRFCPDCGGEFRAGVARCDDCDRELVAELPPAAGPLDPLALAVVFATGDPALLAEAKSRLDGARISYLARGEAGHDLLALERLAPGLRAAPMELLVRAGDWEAAGALLLKAGLAPVEATPEEQKTGELWVDGDENEEEPEEAAPVPPPPGRWSFAADRLRGFELALVLVVAFSYPIFSSLWAWWTGRTGYHSYTILNSLYGIYESLLALAVLAYVLARRGKSFRDLGLTWRKTDPLVGLGLAFAGYLATSFAWRAMEGFSQLATGHRIEIPPSHVAAPSLGLVWSLGFLVTVAVAPFFEEMIARAFTMTEVEALTGSAGLAVAASVLLQTSYHLYLGLPNALAAGATFLVSACYYARFRRITPVILAHALWNLYALLHRL